MGNSYSVVRDEEEEAEFRVLLEAVEIAQRRNRNGVYNDLEAGLDGNAHVHSLHRGRKHPQDPFDPLIGPFESSRWRPEVLHQTGYDTRTYRRGSTIPTSSPVDHSDIPITITQPPQPPLPIIIQPPISPRRSISSQRSAIIVPLPLELLSGCVNPPLERSRSSGPVTTQNPCAVPPCIQELHNERSESRRPRIAREPSPGRSVSNTRSRIPSGPSERDRRWSSPSVVERAYRLASSSKDGFYKSPMSLERRPLGDSSPVRLRRSERYSREELPIAINVAAQARTAVRSRSPVLHFEGERGRPSAVCPIVVHERSPSGASSIDITRSASIRTPEGRQTRPPSLTALRTPIQEGSQMRRRSSSSPVTAFSREATRSPSPIIIRSQSLRCSSPVVVSVPTCSRRSWLLEDVRDPSRRATSNDLDHASGDKYQQLLHMYENLLARWDMQSQQWQRHEETLEYLLRKLNKQVSVERHSPRQDSTLSVDYLPYIKSDARSELGQKESVKEIRSEKHPQDVNMKPYPSLAYAAGLRLRAGYSVDHLNRVWTVFPLKVFRAYNHTTLKIRAEWDDEMLLRELNRTYDSLRTFWRRWFSLRSVGSMTMVLADHSFVYPQRVGPAAVSPSKNMRLRWFLHHPEHMRARHEFMQVLTARTDLGVEFVERWQLSRIAIAILVPVLFSVVIGVVYSATTHDPSTAFTIAGVFCTKTSFLISNLI
ncbi:hypothetical protein AcW1_008555 [Taiwanofungus camphoratus]|nr:hypothetical protein AcW1_008555 [Antrodia cinnamomea]